MVYTIYIVYTLYYLLICSYKQTTFRKTSVLRNDVFTFQPLSNLKCYFYISNVLSPKKRSKYSSK